MWWEVLTRIKWSKVLPIAVVLAAIAAAGVYIFLLKIDVQVAEAERDAAEARQMIAEASYDRCKVNRVVLQAAIDARNEAIRKWKEEARARAEAQGAADSLAFRLAHAEEELRQLEEEHARIVTEAEGLDVCRTYRLALLRIAEP
jgi:hypothetical protein